MTTPTDIVNQAIQLIGDNVSPVTGSAPTFDDSAAGQAAASLYTPCVQTVARQFEWDFARNTAVLDLSGNDAPAPWAFEYLYPANGIEVWQVMPAAFDPNNPLPTNFVVANNLVNSVQTKVIQTDVENAIAVFNNAPLPDVWDPIFREAVVRLLASEMAMALFGRPDTAQAGLESGAAFERLGEERQG